MNSCIPTFHFAWYMMRRTPAILISTTLPLPGFLQLVTSFNWWGNSSIHALNSPVLMTTSTGYAAGCPWPWDPIDTRLFNTIHYLIRLWIWVAHIKFWAFHFPWFRSRTASGGTRWPLGQHPFHTRSLKSITLIKIIIIYFMLFSITSLQDSTSSGLSSVQSASSTNVVVVIS